MTASSELARHFTSGQFPYLAAHRTIDMKRLLLDYCGVALAGSRTVTGQLARRFVTDMGGAAQATVIGAPGRVPAVNAAFANAVAEHSIELDDVDDQALFHYGPPVVSAALAVAEWQHASGKDLLTAMLAGCEMVNRLSLATNPGLRDRGFHTTPTCGVFGAAVAAGRLLTLDSTALTSALGLAGAQASGLMEMYGPSMQKRINPGPAARGGVTAAVLAEMGFTGADTILEGQRGFGVAFAGNLQVDALLRGLGQDVPVSIEFKPYSAARPIHSAIDCALTIRGQGELKPGDIDRIIVYRHPAWAHFHLNDSPSTYHEAQVSLPYSVAVALIDGKATPEQYQDEQLGRPELIDLSHRVTVATDSNLPHGVSCRMVVTRRSDGTQSSCQVDHPKGSLANPLSNDELTQKFLVLAGPVVGEARARLIADAVWTVEQLDDMAPLVGSMTAEEAGPHGA